MTSVAGRLVAVTVGSLLLALSGCSSVRVGVPEPVGRVINVWAYDHDSAIALTVDERAHYLSRVTRNGRALWRSRVPGYPVFRALRVSGGRIYFRYLREHPPGSDEWIESLDGDGHLRWTHLLAVHEKRGISSYDSADPPIDASGVLLEPVRIDGEHVARFAFDANTGWPLWRDGGEGRFSVEAASLGPFWIEQNFGPSWVTNLRTGRAVERTYEGIGCVSNGELITLVPDAEHDRIVGLADADPARARPIGALSGHTDQDRASSLQGCGRYGDRLVLLIETFEGNTTSTSLVELAASGEQVLERPIPELELARSSTTHGSGLALQGTLTRFVPVVIAGGRAGGTLAILDLDSGEIAWKGRQHKADQKVIQDRERWYVYDTDLESALSIQLSIDGRTGHVDAAVRSYDIELAPEHVGDGTVWTQSGVDTSLDHTNIVGLDGTTLAPTGFVGHVHGLFPGLVPRQLSAQYRAEAGL